MTDNLRDVVVRTCRLQHLLGLPGAQKRVELLFNRVHMVRREVLVEHMVVLVNRVACVEDGGHHVDVRISALQAVHVLLPVAATHRMQHGFRDGIGGPAVWPQAHTIDRLKQ